VFVTILTSIIYSFEWLRVLGINAMNDIHEIVGQQKLNYIAKYITYIYLNMILFLVANYYTLHYILHINCILTILFLAWFIYQQPYLEKRHFIGATANIIIIILFGVWSILRQYFQVLLTEYNELITVLTLIFLMVFTLLINIIRVAF